MQAPPSFWNICQLILAAASLWQTGCNTLPAGRIQSSPNVILLRGWRGLWSSGIDQLGNELKANGIPCEVYRAEQWKPLAAEIERSGTADNPPTPLVLIGFSYGADDAIKLAAELGHHRMPVDLLITIDPVTPGAVPPNVRRCIDYYQSNTPWDLFPWLRGVPLRQQSVQTNLLNQNLRRQRPDLLEPHTFHATIAANPKLHGEIVKQVLAVVKPIGT